MQECRICRHSRSCFTLDIPQEEPGQIYQIHICDTCFDAIAIIALKQIVSSAGVLEISQILTHLLSHDEVISIIAGKLGIPYGYMKELKEGDEGYEKEEEESGTN
jgi:hypothetical protein